DATDTVLRGESEGVLAVDVVGRQLNGRAGQVRAVGIGNGHAGVDGRGDLVFRVVQRPAGGDHGGGVGDDVDRAARAGDRGRDRVGRRDRLTSRRIQRGGES